MNGRIVLIRKMTPRTEWIKWIKVNKTKLNKTSRCFYWKFITWCQQKVSKLEYIQLLFHKIKIYKILYNEYYQCTTESYKKYI